MSSLRYSLLPSLALPFACLADAQMPATVAVDLPAAVGWRAQQIHKADSGVWYAHIDKVVGAFGANEVIAADDKGRHLVLSVYSGQWTAHSVVPDGQWLAPSRSADVDPRVPGRELYAGGRAGSVHRTILRPQPFARFLLESVEIGHAAGEEFHTVLAADLLPEPGSELLAFGISGAVFQLAPEGPGSAFTMRQVATVPGRVRDAVVVPAPAGQAPRLLAVSRSGDLLQLQWTTEGLQHRVLLHEDCGLGRIALSPAVPGTGYVTRDDGVVVRVALGADGVVTRQPIFAGAQGLRGIAAGRFCADGREAVAVYGYGKQVQLLARSSEGTFAVETLFEGAQQGHWLCAGELDGRNGTDELVAAGFDGQVVMLAREPGYALPGVAVPKAAVEASADAPRALRIAARIGERALTEMSPLCYQGGFESKTLVYETLVRRGADGRIGPGLASHWRTEQAGRVFVFTLREAATFHDGQPVTADAVATHFKRWVGLPEHGWLRSNARIAAVRATGPRELRFELDRPAALLPDLCAVNPAAVRGPGALTHEGAFVRPVGSGPFGFVEVRENNRVLRYRRHGGGELVDLVRYEGDPLDALLAGDVDAVFGSWLVRVDPARAAALRSDARFQVVDGPGSSMLHLGLRWDRGALQVLERRQAVAAAIDRSELVRAAANGFGDVSTGWAAPSIVDWPQGKPPASAQAAFEGPLRFVTAAADERLAAAIAAQLQRAGIPVEVVAGERGQDWDLRLERTHGVPYDPFTTIVERFAEPVAGATASKRMAAPVDPQLAQLVQALAGEPDEKAWPSHYARIQARLDELLPIVPLYAPRRIAVVRQGLLLPRLDHDMYALDPAWLATAR